VFSLFACRIPTDGASMREPDRKTAPFAEFTSLRTEGGIGHIN
jgi:hypothetical protein